MSRRILTAVVAALTAAVLAACAGMPSAGPVEQGLAVDSASNDAFEVAFRPSSPQPGATPEQIVEGFVAAATSPANGWDIAKQFLTEDAQQTWRPEAGVTVVESRDLTQVTESQYLLTVRSVGDVDETGAYSATDAAPTELPFALRKARGEWRISQLDDGVVLDRLLFPRVFGTYSLMYFDPTWEYLVPDVRWFPVRNRATPWRIVKELIDGAPSPWLADAVVSAFPDDVTVPSAVPTPNGVAQIEVPDAVLGLPPEQLARMQTQLVGSLASANISDALMQAGGVDIEVEPAPTRATTVDPRFAVLTEEGLGFLAGDELQPIPGLSAGLRASGLIPTAIELGGGLQQAALLTDGGAVARLRADQSYSIIDTRPGLITPTVDRYGFVWTVPRDSPSNVHAIGADDTVVEVGDAWSGATVIRAMQLSRDSTRVAAVVEIGGLPEVWTAAVVRDEGVPVRLGQWVRQASLTSSGVAVAWLDDVTLGVVRPADNETTVLTQEVGGLGVLTSLRTVATTIAAGNQLGSVRLLADDGRLYARSGSRWLPSATGVEVLATQQGSSE
ncbi:MAG: GerMN domain-containing protein [Microbacterium sp.]|uniref:GerMN domain-containing protein n=1 Tax=Microbacterium sp. TaxID=51671 RepID=UPI003A85F8EF